MGDPWLEDPRTQAILMQLRLRDEYVVELETQLYGDYRDEAGGECDDTE